MKSKIVLVVLMLFATVCQGQSNNEAQALLKEVQLKIESYKTQQIVFDYRMDPVNRTVTSFAPVIRKGTIKIKGQKYRITINDDFNINGDIKIFDGVKLYSINSLDQIITSVEPDEDEINITPSSMLASFQMANGFAMVGKKTTDGKIIQYIKLNPTSEGAIEVIVGIYLKEKQLYSYQLFGRDNVVTIFTVISYIVNEPLADVLFTFNRDEYKDFYFEEE